MYNSGYDSHTIRNYDVSALWLTILFTIPDMIPTLHVPLNWLSFRGEVGEGGCIYFLEYFERFVLWT